MQSSTEKAKKPRGRPRAYDPEQALASATEQFWHAGYAGTSLDDLSEATGMNRPSLYGAFGDKHALYMAAMERYIAEGRAAIEAALADDLALPQALMRMVDSALESYYSPSEAARGCFLIGTAVTESMDDPEVRETLNAGLRLFDRCIEARFKRSKARGELPADADASMLAKIAGALIYTMAMRSRAGESRAILRAMAAAGVRLICGASSVSRKRGTT